ncbi:ABC transporter permease [Spirochaetia bacterium]|nr:ABC transporter permease [Spirochaetia bacterium]
MHENNPSAILRTLLRNNTFTVTVILFLFCVIATIFSPYFLTPFNLQALMRDIAFIAMIAVGQSMLLLLGELDLSVGAAASLCGILTGLMMTKGGLPPGLAVLLGVIVGLAMGAINGIIITKLKLNAMVATIGMQGIFNGTTLVITKGKAVTNIPESIHFLGKGSLGTIIPNPFIISLAVVVIATMFVSKTRRGRYIYAIGNSKPAAEILGIKVDRIRILTFSIVGVLSSIAGILYVTRLGSAQGNIGTTWPMNSIAGSVIGGVLLTGGVGNPVGAYIGAAILMVISNVIVLLGVNIYWQQAVSGFVVVVAIALPSVFNIIRENKRIKSIDKT